MEARGTNSRDLIRILDERFAANDRDEWIRRLKQEGCICTPVQTLTEVTQDPQAFANNYFIEIDHPVWKRRVREVGFPWDFSGTPASWRKPAPQLGEHTEEILTELGYSKEEIERLRSSRVIL
jgi:crotonobetainyl-CoA:carnitine CoA-transferase CaiB-like acyl-CoA transferase